MRAFVIALGVGIGFGSAAGLGGQEPGSIGSEVRPAADADAEANAPPTEAERAIDAAIESIRGMAAIAADIALDADMLGHRFRVVGQYVKADGNRMLLRLTVEGLPGGSGTMQQVSDGQTFKDYRRVLDVQQMTTFQMEPVLRILDAPDADAEFRRQVVAQLGMAGPEALLEGLRRTARFDQMSEETWNDRPVRVIRGLWKDREALALPANQTAQLQAGFLPSYVPSHITLWLDRETGWPWKLQMQGKLPSVLREERILGPDGRPIGRKTSQSKDRPSTLTLSYTLVDRPIDPNEFFFEAPPNISVQDITEQLTAGLQNAFAQLSQRRRREEAEQGGRLEQSLPAPGPDTPAPPTPGPVPSPEEFRSSVPLR
ncbi:MAG: hypothetical protein KatS3mg108_1127 [Isosphaeraceae bacterium]|jgi:hypothetical protein|nr:MAG: hypothetical protein KatS3mg108_1127 [Isosphaeraceae bacterium]